LRRYNAKAVADAANDDMTPSRWARVVWIEGGKAIEDLRLRVGSHVTPFEYATHYLCVPLGWQPTNWLDVPPVEWPQSAGGSRPIAWGQGITAESQAQAVIKSNRKGFLETYGEARGRKTRCWNVAIATEAGPRHEDCHLDASAGQPFGTMTTTERRRFHIITPAWPAAAGMAWQITTAERKAVAQSVKAAAAKGGGA
jgi:hypothetical protein